MEYCKSCMKTTMNSVLIKMNHEEYDHFCDPAYILVKKIIGYILTRCKEELTSLPTIYEKKIRKVKLNEV